MSNINGYIEGLKKKNAYLSQLVEEMASCAEEKAKAEYAFEVAFAKCILGLRADGEPATLINKLAAGDRVVADLKLKAEIAKGVYAAKQSAIKATHVAIDTYRSLLSYEKEEYKRTMGGADGV